jgi:hypothetical protein
MPMAACCISYLNAAIELEAAQDNTKVAISLSIPTPDQNQVLTPNGQY